MKSLLLLHSNKNDTENLIITWEAIITVEGGGHVCDSLAP